MSRSGGKYRAAKRVMDVTLTALALVVCWPLVLLIALIVRLDSPGPPWFAQPRLGYRQRVFGCFKFRTMFVAHGPQGAKPDSAADERVTRFGRWLRRTSLDELPQLFNILRGDMSLVGPRPEQAYLLPRYTADGRHRFDVLPGLTGWWQVSGRPQPMYEHVAYDLYYVEHRSLWLDAKILLLTVRAVLRGDGAI